MHNFNTIKAKLEAFTKRFYTNELLKGIILFFAIGLLYFLFTLFIEYILWLNTAARTILFWLFIIVEIALLIKFIVMPIAKLFKLKKGINYVEASKIIGNHFPEVNDKLLNILQLENNQNQTELLLASIEQKATELKPIPFKLAVNFKDNIKYLKYAAIPVLILLVTFLTDNLNWFSKSYDRVVHYKTAFEPPAPFQFIVDNANLQTVENKDYKLVVKTVGDFVPENVKITYNNESYFLKQTNLNTFEYTFTQPKQAVNFSLSANKVTSKSYTLNIINAPLLLNFNMHLKYPNYIKKKPEILKGTGNALVPEGTKITWKLNTKSTDFVNFISNDTVKFLKSNNNFETSKTVLNNLNYSISTNNEHLKNYENLNFNIDVIKDQFPELKVDVKTDTTDAQTLYFHGKATDDYGFTKLQLVYYPTDDETDKKSINIPFSTSNAISFISAFPNTIPVKDGVSYSLYFQITDNDYVNKYKSVKSHVFNYRKRTKDEDTEKQLQDQSKTINQLNKSLEKFNTQEKSLEAITKTQKEKQNLSFNDKKTLESFLKRQKQQDEMMKNFSKKLKDNFEDFQQDRPTDAFKEDLKKRLNDNEEQLKKDEKLLEELEKLQDKISKEDLVKKLDDLAKQNKNKKRSLQQLLELTKRFYVEKKLETLKDNLSKISEEQEKLSKDESNTNSKEKQEQLNKAFEDFTKALDDLKKDNENLKKPFDIPQDKLEENEIKKEQKEATNALNNQEEQQNNQKQKAQQKQKNAAKKMKQMLSKMQSSIQMNAGEQMQEDMEMLRQILDNLVLFSFDQEALMNKFKNINENHNKYASHLKNQYNLKEHFQHIDDSLFALSTRQPKLSEDVNKEITEVYFNIDKAISLFADNNLYQGVSNQQFAITAANNLADFLSNVLDNMQENMNMSAGQGSGDQQLPDIIMSQEQLNQMMKDTMNDSQKKGEQKKGNQEGNKPGDKSGEKNDGNQGSQNASNGSKPNEDLNGKLFEIYQKQQQLRQDLEEQINKQGLKGNSNHLLKQMEDIELELLNKGFTNNTLNKMLNLKHQLLKLDKAAHEQGEENKRESKTNNNNFSNPSNNQLNKAKEYFNTIEILDKQAVPLQNIYKKKVQQYFNKGND